MSHCAAIIHFCVICSDLHYQVLQRLVKGDILWRSQNSSFRVEIVPGIQRCRWHSFRRDIEVLGSFLLCIGVVIVSKLSFTINAPIKLVV
jgi:hypothetical protein